MNIKKLIALICGLIATVQLCACSFGGGAIGGADGRTAVFVTSDEPIWKQLYENKIKYIGDASKTGEILNKLAKICDSDEYDGIELQTSDEPYGLIRKFKISSDKAEVFELEKQAAIILALIENAEYVEYCFSDWNVKYTISDINEKYNTDLKQCTDTQESFKKLYDILYN